MEDETSTTAETHPLPAFARIGLFVLAFGVAAWMGLHFFTPSYLADPPSADVLNVNEYRKSLEAAQRVMELRSMGLWIAGEAISGGFLMWLAGAAVCALRRANQQ